MSVVKLAVIGSGSRGQRYASYAKENPQKAQVVAVAEPCESRRERMAKEYNIPENRVFTTWQDLAKEGKIADAVIISTQDSMHKGPAIAFAEKGYHILLEKPMAPSEDDCKQIADAAVRSGVIFSVCHVMRYTVYTQKLKELIQSGVIGEIVSIQHLESVGYWHQAHSYVRGNWRNESLSSSMLLAKSCHDLDWIQYIVGSRCVGISSFGNLKHFIKENKPAGAGLRCLECSCESACPYSAKKIYIKERAEQGYFGWPVDVLTDDLTVEGVMAALETGPYGRCVYECDNDVVDHQVVNMLFENNVTSVFTMTAFAEARDRITRVFGTEGEIYGDGSQIRIYDFLTEQTKIVDTGISDGTILTGHGGGDEKIMKSFIAAVDEGDHSKILSSAQESLETHMMVFAAEKARKEMKVAIPQAL
jgi:predicted dehydrogenase